MLLTLLTFSIKIFVLIQASSGAVSGLQHRNIQQWRHKNKTGDINWRPSVQGVVNLFSMIECATDCDPWTLKYYGNYCGYGGSGIPKDDIDSCCEQHDACYDEISQSYECSGGKYLKNYQWRCNDRNPTCLDGFDRCQFWTCTCDRAFMECLNDSGCPA